MPAIITHDFFGRDLIESGAVPMGPSQAERQAFLLGNQGPDPLFYSVVGAGRMKDFTKLGSTMHHEKTVELLMAFKKALGEFQGADLPIARAYTLGFLCHYSLDVSMHPFVYFWQYALCDAGVEGLTRKDGHEVHAAIESELDEMVLYSKQGLTVKEFAPQEEILKSSDYALSQISRLYDLVVQDVWGLQIPEEMFTACVKRFRVVAGVFHSRSGTKRQALGRFEELIRPYSFMRAMSHRALPLEDSGFANSARGTWIEPSTGLQRTDSFWDIFNAAQEFAAEVMASFVEDDFDVSQAETLVANRNFDGEVMTESE